jgi:hypothetical protein
VDRGRVRTAFEDPVEFTTSPLYRCLSRTVAATDQLLDLACQGRPGQYPTFLFFGAVHLLLLAGAEHPLARFYPSMAADPGERAWLEALVWPENHRQRALLAVALGLAAADPPPIRAGDAIDVLPGIAGALPAGQPRVVFHTATRMHVPAGRLAAFDAAIGHVGDTGPLWLLSIEDAPDAQSRALNARRGPRLATAAARRCGGRDNRHRRRAPRLDRDVPLALAAGLVRGTEVPNRWGDFAFRGCRLYADHPGIPQPGLCAKRQYSCTL